MTARLGKLDETGLTDDRRIGLWVEGLSVFAHYPLLGTGSGTYTWVEPTARTKTGYENISAVYAHNEYVEALVEGGILRLALTLLLVVAPVFRVIRRYIRVAERSEGPLLLGGLYGILAIALHSFVDFGVHMPAVAVLAIVLLASLMRACDRRGPSGVVRSPVLAVFAASRSWRLAH